MSKGDGAKIAIKFTQELVGDVAGKAEPIAYKYYRWYITSTWSGSRLYLYELEFFSNGKKVNTNKIISMAGSSRYSSSYDVDRLFDGSVPGREWDANGSLPHWVSIELDEAIIIDSFRWHTGTSSNKPKEFILQGSNNGIDWVDIYMDESPNLNNWIDFVVAGVGNEIAFTVTGKERKHINGVLIDGDYEVYKVEPHPTEEKSILLIMNPIKRFNNVEGDLTVKYDASKGSLSGRGGAVESFIETFTPTDLVPKPNPGVAEKITIMPNISNDFIKVDYNYRYTSEKITAIPNISVELIDAEVVNP
jgi:hypothetical protein